MNVGHRRTRPSGAAWRRLRPAPAIHGGGTSDRIGCGFSSGRRCFCSFSFPAGCLTVTLHSPRDTESVTSVAMKCFFRFLVLALVSLGFDSAAHAAGMNIDSMVSRLDQLVHLSSQQRSEAAAIF